MLGTVAVGGAVSLTVASLLPGSHQLSAVYDGDAVWNGSSAVVTVTPALIKSSTSLAVTRNGSSQVLFTAQVHGGATAPDGTVQFADAATNTVLASATLSNGTASASIDAKSKPCSVVANYLGSATFAASLSAPSLCVVNAASYAGSMLAADEVGAIFRVSVLSGDLSGMGSPLPTILGGMSVTVTDSQGRSQPAGLYAAFSASGQVNSVMPADVAPGLGLLTIAGPGGNQSTVVDLESVAPGLFTQNASGRGVPAAQLVRVHTDGSQSFEDVASYDAASASS